MAWIYCSMVVTLDPRRSTPCVDAAADAAEGCEQGIAASRSVDPRHAWMQQPMPQKGANKGSPPAVQ
jgi:hypothetical protein